MCAWAQWSRNSTFSAGFSPHLKHLQLLGASHSAGIAARSSCRRICRVGFKAFPVFIALEQVPSPSGAAGVIPTQHKGDFPALVRSGQSFCVFQAAPLPCLSRLGRQDPALAGAHSRAIVPARSSVAGCSWPFGFPACAGMSSLGMKRGLLSGSPPALGAPPGWG